jgi:alpha-1,3-rhamnosyl/mannosyltransferase
MGGTPLLGHLTGIGHYTRQLGHALQTQGLLEDLKLWGDIGFIDPELVSASAASPATSVDAPRGRSTLLRDARQLMSKSYVAALLYERLSGFAAARRLAPFAATHIYHSPNFVLPRFDGPKVMTVHDLSVIRFPEFHRRQMVEICERGIRRAIGDKAHIIVDSDLVGRELKTHFGVGDELVTTVHLTASADCRPRTEGECRDVLTQWRLPFKGFFLSVGTIEPRKNLVRLFTAFRAGRQEALFDWPLVVVGGRGWKSTAEHALLDELCRDGLAIYLDYVDDGSLLQLYAAAGALVFPSLYEGFGLPVAEAMASGCPVVTSRGTAMEEFATPDTMLIDPLDEAGLRDAMGWVASLLPSAEKNLADNTRTWVAVAEETAEVYRQSALGA